jgi:hypothetical protein
MRGFAYKIAAIPTFYAGVQYRSRLEARWAAFFDLVGWRHDYEPMDLKGWTPDFLLHLREPVLVEVKPVLTEEVLAEFLSTTSRCLGNELGNGNSRAIILGNGPIDAEHGDDMGPFCSLGFARGLGCWNDLDRVEIEPCCEGLVPRDGLWECWVCGKPGKPSGDLGVSRVFWKEAGNRVQTRYCR